MTRRDAFVALASLIRSRPDYMLMDSSTKRLLKNEWPQVNRRIFPGSLLKPFLALAYGEEHRNCFPELTCRACWKPGGHGRLSLAEAIAYSCNSYFLALAHDCSAESLARIATFYGLPPPEENSPKAWIGFGAGWPVTPLDLSAAYSELRLRAAEPGPALVLQGLRQSAVRGTGRGVRAAAFIKTGTGQCRHNPRSSGDGYALALFPAGTPRYTLLTSIHDSPGSEAARVAGDLIRRLAPGEV